ncbi:MAG: valine--tRNA ligase [Buchnera aphidicola (Schlechtendalia peitan)]
MKKYFDPISIEQHLYIFWEKNGYFKPNSSNKESNFCIVLPPPNITGDLHIGHAFQYTIMDILIRYHRMQGKNTFWQVGTDHAGIATQILLEKKILVEHKKTLKEYGKKNFIEKAWKWKEKYIKKITGQMRRLGISVDWTKEKFTLDPEVSMAVKEAFIILYNQKLIYKRKKLVNWDPVLKTVISDLEVQNRDTPGKIWYIKYTLIHDHINKINYADDQYLTVATTRPETLFGDTALAVHPKDIRYKKFIGKKVLVPLINRVIPVIGDKFVQMKKGTGCVKVTPAHDFNDFEIGMRHNLPIINIFTLDGNISKVIQEYNFDGKVSCIYTKEIPSKYHDINRFLARELIIDELIENHKLEKEEVHNLTIPYGDRSNSIIEPLLTNQWYLNVSSLAEVALRAVQHGDIEFVPKNYEKMYFSWMKNIEDWCISRQLWWGHQIPVWYDKDNNTYVGQCEKDVRKKYNLSNDIELIQDSDVLDTWFSSGLWMFASLGWPKNTNLLKRFYSTNVVVSGFDIIFFWISRMIMLSMHFMKDEYGQPKVPFKKVYITGLICDENGRKMSKSEGNVIDPIDMIDGITLDALIEKRTQNMLHPELSDQIRKRTKDMFPSGINATGTDALRFTCAALASPTRRINWSVNRLRGYRNFCNKLWNASRFLLLKIDKNIEVYTTERVLSVADRWILLTLNTTIKRYRFALDTYRFDVASNILYEFIWNEFCDFYIELIKPFIISCSDLERAGTQYTLLYVLEVTLRLAHPIIPFITEAIWQKIQNFLKIKSVNSIMLCSFPKYDSTLQDDSVLKDVEWIQNITVILRKYRVNMELSYKVLIPIYFYNIDIKTSLLIQKYRKYLKIILYLKDVLIIIDNETKSNCISYSMLGSELLIPILGNFSKDVELKKVKKEILKINLKIQKLELKLLNKNFLKYAPGKIIDDIRECLKKNQLKYKQLCLKKNQLC